MVCLLCRYKEKIVYYHQHRLRKLEDDRKTEEQKLRSRTAEINNGRLAMIGIMGFIAASTVPGSVPYFTEDLTQYSGSVWAPF